MDVAETVTVYPEPGNFGAVARALLAAADHPYQVVSVSHPKAGFRVPADVFERFEDAASSDRQEAPPGETEPRKRKSARSRKNIEPAVKPDPVPREEE